MRAHRDSNAPIIRCTTCTQHRGGRYKSRHIRAMHTRCSGSIAQMPKCLYSHCWFSHHAATCGSARYCQSYLLKEYGGHLAVQRRLERKVDLEVQPGGVRGGAQPDTQGRRRQGG
jgi:ribosomal protein S27E